MARKTNSADSKANAIKVIKIYSDLSGDQKELIDGYKHKFRNKDSIKFIYNGTKYNLGTIKKEQLKALADNEKFTLISNK